MYTTVSQYDHLDTDTLCSNTAESSSLCFPQVCRFDPRMRLSANRVSQYDHLDTDGLRSIQLSGNYISCGEQEL